MSSVAQQFVFYSVSFVIIIIIIIIIIRKDKFILP